MEVFAQLTTAIEQRDCGAVRRLRTEHRYLLHFELTPGWPVLHRCIVQGCADVGLLKLFVANGGDVQRETDGGASLAFLAATTARAEVLGECLNSCGARMTPFDSPPPSITPRALAGRRRFAAGRM